MQFGRAVCILSPFLARVETKVREGDREILVDSHLSR